MRLLVSVRSASEALSALAGGANLIDVKEPARGPLGRADASIIDAIAAVVDGGASMSAAMGELRDSMGREPIHSAVAFIKFGLAGCRGLPWQPRLLHLRETNRATVVPAVYADAEQAEGPSLEEAAAFAIDHHFEVLLVDTYRKDGRSLFDWQTGQTIKNLVDALRRAGTATALAGSLRVEHLPRLRAIDPAWAAVRGAVCLAGNRSGEIDERRVREWSAFLKNLEHGNAQNTEKTAKVPADFTDLPD